MPFLGRSRTLFRIFGFPIKIHPTWFFLFMLIVFSLSSKTGLFRQWMGDEPVGAATYWALGVLGALGLFASLIAHELAHSVVARYTGIPVKGITLFIFGGVSELGDEPPTAASEFFMAVVGPLSSVLIAFVFLAGWMVGFARSWPVSVRVLLQYLAMVNFVLAFFNSLPAFPLDGGRVARSILWGLSGDIRTATLIAGGIGSAFALLLIIAGVWAMFRQAVLGGIWLVFIGIFLRQAAAGSLQQVRMRHSLGGEVVGRFMSPNLVTVGPDLTLRRFVDQYALPYHFAIFPVVDEEGRLIGAMHACDPTRVDQADWERVTVGELMRDRSADTEMAPGTDAVEALVRLTEESTRLMVVENDRPIGIISQRDLLDFLALKSRLSGGRRPGR